MAKRRIPRDAPLFDLPNNTPDPASRESPTVPTVELIDAAQSRYLNYALSVITSRALPDVRDGLKPVQRRILYTMWEQRLRATTKPRKSAKVVGDVMGSYHPHGDTALYDTLVRLAQPFALRYPLVDGHGNFGSLDGDSAAAMRYTECRLATLSAELLEEIDQDTVPFRPNYDGSKTEPVVLPARLPNLLINGATGIAVGMATNIPPHHVGEVCTALLKLLDNPELSSVRLCTYIKG
ncbi:MAG: DNA gyrase subunit A, partial [Acidobacteriota bacterium]|nr:DNA gyrase subunit A [Acidobacteriota bacterium]